MCIRDSFPCHPYKVRDDESMLETAESVKTFGVLVPIIVRPCDDGGYEIISGHKMCIRDRRQGYRSGHYSRNLTTTSGDVTLKVPKLKGLSLIHI